MQRKAMLFLENDESVNSYHQESFSALEAGMFCSVFLFLMTMACFGEINRLGAVFVLCAVMV